MGVGRLVLTANFILVYYSCIVIQFSDYISAINKFNYCLLKHDKGTIFNCKSFVSPQTKCQPVQSCNLHKINHNQSQNFSKNIKISLWLGQLIYKKMTK